MRSVPCPFKWCRNVEPGSLWYLSSRVKKVFQGEKSQEQMGICYESRENKEIIGLLTMVLAQAQPNSCQQVKGEFSSLNGCEVTEPGFVSLSLF